MRDRVPILALALGAFGIGVTEFSPMGMLPFMASDLGVSIPTAGILVSAYALGVVIGAPIMTLTTTAIPRRTLLIALMGLYTIGNALAALSGSYTTLLVARIITSLNHGAFFGVGSVVAASLVPESRRASAVAAMFSGLAISNIGGVPLAAWLSAMVGWRLSFWGMTAIGLVTMVCLRLTLPLLRQREAVNVGSELAVFRRPAVLYALMVTVLSSSAFFTVFTYIAPILRDEANATPTIITGMLVLFGISLTIGNWLGGRFADRSVDGTLVVILLAIMVALASFSVTMHSLPLAALSMAVWGAATFASASPLQMRVITAAVGAPSLASSINIGAFNLGNAIGAAAGGGVIGLGWGYPAVCFCGALFAAVGLFGLMASRSRSREPEALHTVR